MEIDMTKSYTYTFQTSEPLTEAQIDWLNLQLFDNLPSEKEDLSDIPWWTTEVKLAEDKED